MVLEELLYDATRRSRLAHARHYRKRHVFRERMSRKKRLQAHESRCGRNVAFPGPKLRASVGDCIALAGAI